MEPNFKKDNGLIPAIIQDHASGCILMLGYMNEEAYNKTCRDGKVTFFSRSKGRLWTKGETSGNFLLVKSMIADCDSDALLIQVEPVGATCHTGNASCFGAECGPPFGALAALERTIKNRRQEPLSQSYTCRLFREGRAAMAQKVGEEAVEVVVAALAQDQRRLVSEGADLLYHLLVLLSERDIGFAEVVQELGRRRTMKAKACG